MKKKIIFAFLIVAVIPAIVTIVAANLFARRELEAIRRDKATAGLARLDANIVHDLAAMGSAAKNEAASPQWRRIFLRKGEPGQLFQAQLINHLAERTKQAQWDFSVVIDTAGVVLARGDNPSSFGDTINFRSIFAARSISKPTASAAMPMVHVWGTGGLLGIAPIVYQEKTLGYLLIGKDFTVEHLRGWVGGWAIPSMIVGPERVLTRTRGAPEVLLSAELITELYQGPRVASVYLGDRRYLVARERLTDTASGKPSLMVLLFFDSAPVDTAVEKLLYSLLAAAGLGLLLALIFGARAARLLTRPLDDIIEASQRISRGDWDADVISFSEGEAGRMAEAFNRMIGDLRRSRDRLIQTERIAAWRDAARKVAHEIKNPLSPIRIAAEDLVSAYKPDDPGFAATLKQSVKTISEEVGVIKRFVDEFASFARTPRPVFAPLDVKELLAESAAAFPAENKAGRISVDTTRSLPINGDIELLRQSMVNLIKNGLEAGGPDGTVTITAVDEDDTVLLIVDDTGPGFSEEAKEKLFMPFATDKPGGTGLGLVIVQGIIGDHGGTISVRENPDGGARLVVRLPKTPPPLNDR